MSEGILETIDLTKSFGGLTVVDSVSLALGTKQVHAVIGPNGAGKTTLFNLISGALKQDRGEILLEGENISHLKPWERARRGLARSFQITNLFPDLTVAETVALCVNAHRPRPWDPFRQPMADPDVRERIEWTCEVVGLGDLMHMAVANLSQADQRLLEIATVVGTRPRVMLLDEPTQGVAAHEVERLERVIGGLKEVASILVIEHNMECVLEIADVVTVLVGGAVMAEGTASDIMANADVQNVYLGTSSRV